MNLIDIEIFREKQLVLLKDNIIINNLMRIEQT